MDQVSLDAMAQVVGAVASNEGEFAFSVYNPIGWHA